MLTNCLDLAALLIQITGTIIMFLNAPKNEPKGSFIYASNPDYEAPKRRERRTKRGFLLLAIGFAIQLISLIVKMLSVRQ
jgi:hypothetical protein